MTNKIFCILTRGVEKVVPRKEVEQLLQSGKKLRVKHGVDPTASDLHLGYAVIYEKLRVLQELGHKIVFLIGDFTARFGDPTDENQARKMRDKKEVMIMAKNYIDQLAIILDIKKVEVQYNGKWYDKMNAEDLLRLISNFTTAQMLERDMFSERIKKGEAIGLHEPVYPVLQGYDSVMLKSDLTVIGNDQLFNELQARPLQEKAKQKPQGIITMKMLAGTDGKLKMSQSLGNYIGFTEPAKQQYGKIMSISDEQILPYFELVTRISMDKIKEMEKEMKSDANPRDFKMRLAREVVSIYHNVKAAQEAEKEFIRVFQKKELPKDIQEKIVDKKEMTLLDLIYDLETTSSKSEARRLIEQSGVKIDDVVQRDATKKIKIKDGMIARAGKYKTFKIKK